MKACQYIFMTFKKTLKICQAYSRPFKMFHILHKHFQNFQNYKKNLKIFNTFEIFSKSHAAMHKFCACLFKIIISEKFTF